MSNNAINIRVGIYHQLILSALAFHIAPLYCWLFICIHSNNDMKTKRFDKIFKHFRVFGKIMHKIDRFYILCKVPNISAFWWNKAQNCLSRLIIFGRINWRLSAQAVNFYFIPQRWWYCTQSHGFRVGRS